MVDIRKRLECAIKDGDSIDIGDIEDAIYSLDILEIDIEKVQDGIYDYLY